MVLMGRCALLPVATISVMPTKWIMKQTRIFDSLFAQELLQSVSNSLVDSRTRPVAPGLGASNFTGTFSRLK
jgi:hypothetical protein